MPKKWSGEVTKHSTALKLDEGVFTWESPLKIAKSLKKSAENSEKRKGTPLQSAMGMLDFYINRAGKNLPKERLEILDKVKAELRSLFDEE